VATDTTISCSLGRQYGPLLGVFFFDVYASNLSSQKGILTWAQCYKTNCRVKLLLKMGFFTQKSEISKFHHYKNFMLKRRVK
jgi:hypothetical protein